MRRHRPVFPALAITLVCLPLLALTPPLAAETLRGVVYEDLDRDGQHDAGEPGVTGVAVSNGSDVVRTDESGAYSLEIDPEEIVFVTKPSGYALPLDKQELPRFYYRYFPEGSAPGVALRYRGVDPTGPLPSSVDFPLHRSEEPDAYRAVLLADTQPQNNAELGFLRDDVLAAIASTDAAFGMTLGDILYDDLSLFPRYKKLIGALGIPWYNLPGNHEINYRSPDAAHARETFKRHFGPPYYSFEYGKVHFVALDTVHYLGEGEGRKKAHPRGAGSYVGRLGERQLAWLAADLAGVPEERLVVLTMHIPLASRLDPEGADVNVGDRGKLFKILSGRPHLLALAGHLHLVEHLYFGKKEGFRGPTPLHLHTLATASGSWWTGPVDERGIPTTWQRDGAPNGSYVLEVEGNSARVRFLPAGLPAAEQMRIMLDAVFHGTRPNNLLHSRHGEYLSGPIDTEQLHSTRILTNLFDGGPHSRLELRVDGGAPIPMTPVVEPDPFIVELFARYPQTLKSWIRPLPSHHLWAAPLPTTLLPGTHRLEVRALDEYGAAHTALRLMEVIAR